MGFFSIFFLAAGAILMVFGIFRFTIYRSRFTKPLNIAGFSVSPEMVSIILFAIGFACILMFVVMEIQPMYYKGRELQRNMSGGY